jgi:hypothetical protein
MMVASFVISKISLQILRAAPLATIFSQTLSDSTPYKDSCSKEDKNNVPNPSLLIN